MEGWIKIHRKIQEWGWYKDGNTFRVFIHLLLNASLTDKHYMGYPIKRGDVVIGRKALASQLDLSEMQIRTALNKLKSTSEITIKTTNKFSVVTINNFDKYQSFDVSNNQQDNQQDNQQITNKQPTNNQQITTSKESKESKECKNNNNYILKDIVCDTAEVSPTPSDKIVALKNKNPNTPYSQIVELYNDTCGAAFGMVTSLSIQRKKHLKILFRDLNHDLDTIRHLFIKAKESDFLRGHNKRSWRATFDWLIKINNAVKVLDGNYDNKHTGGELEAVFARFLAKEN